MLFYNLKKGAKINIIIAKEEDNDKFCLDITKMEA